MLKLNFSIEIEAVLNQRIKGILPVGCDFEISRQQLTTLTLKPRADLKRSIVAALPEIAATINGLLPLHLVQIGQDRPLEVAAILNLWPAQPYQPLHQRLEEEHQGLVREIAEAAISELRCDRSIFLLSGEGVYLRAELAHGATPPCPAEEMVGRTVEQVLGSEAHGEILRQMRVAHQSNIETSAFYQAPLGNEIRTYLARIRPLVGELAWVSVTRL